MLNSAIVFQSERLHFLSLLCICAVNSFCRKAPPSPAHVAPSLIKSGGSVISSVVLWDLLLPKSDRSSQTGVGQTDRNSLPCRHQSPLLLTIILICAFPLVFTPGTPQCLLPTTRMFNRDGCWQPDPSAAFSITDASCKTEQKIERVKFSRKNHAK